MSPRSAASRFLRLHSPRQRVGAAAEDIAMALLTARGLRCVARNWRCRTGELDLVMRDHGTLVFVEVRKRGSARYGGASASIDARKQARIIRTARAFLAEHGECSHLPARFDAVLFEGTGQPRWLKAAFTCA
ncbi:MAG TPA: YraN family protein [Nevskiaceae bacterium]